MDYNKNSYYYNYYGYTDQTYIPPPNPGSAISNNYNMNVPASQTNWSQNYRTAPNTGFNADQIYNSYQGYSNNPSYSNNQQSNFYNDMCTVYPLPYQNKRQQSNNFGQNSFDNTTGSNFNMQSNYEPRNPQSTSKRPNSSHCGQFQSTKSRRFDSYQMANGPEFDPYEKRGMAPCRGEFDRRRTPSRSSGRDRRQRDRNHRGHSRDRRRRPRNPSQRVPMPPSQNRDGSEEKETVRLAYNLFRPPASLRVLDKKVSTLRSWQEDTLNELNLSSFVEDESPSKVTTLLSDVAQKVLRMNMVFLYAFVEEIPPSETEIFKEFYGECDKTYVLSEMYMDDIFISQGIGSSRLAARESACEKALELFKENSVHIFPVTRTYNNDPLEIYCASAYETLEEATAAGKKFPPFIRSPWRDCNKKAPWLQRHGRLNHSGPKEEPLPYEQAVGEFFLLIDNGRAKDKQPPSILNNSAQFNRINLDYKISRGNPFTECTVLLHDHEYMTGSGLDVVAAKNAAASNAFQELQKTQPLIKMRLHKTRLVPRSELEGFAKKLAEEKGYKPSDDFERSRMKEEHLAKLEEDSEAFFVNYVNEIKESLDNRIGDENIDIPLKFGDDFTHDEKMAIHKAARRFQLTSKPYGPPKKNYLLVSSHYSLLKTKKLLLLKGHAGRYELVSNGSVDLTNLLEREEPGPSEYVMLIPPYNAGTVAAAAAEEEPVQAKGEPVDD